MTTRVTAKVTDAAEDDEDDGGGGVSELITRILLEHFGDGRPVHADIVMDTVQYRLARDDAVERARGYRLAGADDAEHHHHYYNADDRWRQHEYYCIWADPQVSQAYHRCLLLLVRSGRVRVLYDCAGGCGGYREDDDDGRHCTGGCQVTGAQKTARVRGPARHPKPPTAGVQYRGRSKSPPPPPIVFSL